MNSHFCGIEDIILKLYGQLPMADWLCINRRIVVGFHPLATCEDSEEGMEAKQVLESLQHTFIKYEVVRTGNSLYPIIPYFGINSK